MTSALKPMELELDLTNGQLVYLPMPNFSYNYIPTGCCVRIPQYQEMVVNTRVVVEGRLVIQGSLIFLR